MEPRQATEQELHACAAFADMVFQLAGTDISFESSLPKVYRTDSGMGHIHRLITDASGDIRGLVGLLPGVLHTRCGDLKTGYIGSVSVHPDSRRQGMMRQLMVDQLKSARESGMDLLMLGGQRDRYGYYGFAQGGQCWRYEFTAASLRHALADVDADSVSFEPLLADSPEEAFSEQLHREQTAWFDREHGFVTTCRSYYRTPYKVLDGLGRMMGCITVRNDHPEDISQLLTFSCQAMDRILKAWMTSNKLTRCSLEMPEWNREQRLHLGTWCEDVSLQPACMVLVLEPVHVIETLLNLKSGMTKVTDGAICFEYKDKAWTVKVSSGHCRVNQGGKPQFQLNEQQLGTMLFGTFPTGQWPQVPQDWFPLPLSVPVADQF